MSFKAKMQVIQCIYCEIPMEIDVEFAINNERVFCGNCCKAFDVKIDKKKIEEEEEDLDFPDFPDDGW